MPIITVDDIQLHDDTVKQQIYDMPNDQDVQRAHSAWVDAGRVHVHMPQFSDGRAFSQARRLRQLGFRGTIRIVGHVIPDQLPHALGSGVDEIEISQELLDRTTPEAWFRCAAHQRQWLRYQQRLTQGV